MTRVLVLGANGFIGRNLVESLLLRRDVSVTGFGRTPGLARSVNFRSLEGDLNDYDTVASAVKSQDIVFHLISQTIPASSWEDPVGDIESNLMPAVRLIATAAAEGVKRIAFASSGGTVYGLQEARVDETARTQPFSPYGIIKRAIESFLEYARIRHGIDYDIYRISNVYGEGQEVGKGLGFINTALERIVNGKPVVVYGDGETIRDYIYVGDVAKFLATSLDRAPGYCGLYNVSANRPMSLNALLSLIRNVTGASFDIQYVPSRLNDNKKVMIDSSKLIAEVPSIKPVTLEDGIERTYEFLKKRLAYVEKAV